MYKLQFFVILFLISFGKIATAEKFVSYYASIKSSEVNVRKGPNARYPIDWVYKKKGEPVEVIGQFEHWHRIRDISGDEGWIKTVMLSKKRFGVINIPKPKKTLKTNKEVFLYAKLYHKPDALTKEFAHIEDSQRVDITQCQKQWCKIKVKDISGWIEKQDLWGVYPDEEFKK